VLAVVLAARPGAGSAAGAAMLRRGPRPRASTRPGGGRLCATRGRCGRRCAGAGSAASWVRCGAGRAGRSGAWTGRGRAARRRSARARPLSRRPAGAEGAGTRRFALVAGRAQQLQVRHAVRAAKSVRDAVVVLDLEVRLALHAPPAVAGTDLPLHVAGDWLALLGGGSHPALLHLQEHPCSLHLPAVPPVLAVPQRHDVARL